jgi:hypothetical protein
MNYVFHKEVGELDAWVAGLDEATIESSIGEAALAEKKRLARQAQVEQEELTKPMKTIDELKEELVGLLLPGETISMALRRLAGKQGESFHIECMIYIIHHLFLIPMCIIILYR